MVKVSIIVPIYNAEKYLERCILSILNQTLYDIELILVNDGSLDKSKEICNKYLNKDCRIKVIHKENGGVSSARNIGIDNAVGDYIGFVDPDDYLDNDAIEYLYKLISLYKADIACYKMKTYKNNNRTSSELEKEEIKLYNNEKIIEIQVKQGEFLYSSCNKLYSRNLFNGVNDRFVEEIRYAEDALFNIHVMSKAKKLVNSNLRKYNYFINERSTVENVSEKRIDILKAQKEMLYFLKNTYNNYTEEIIKQYINSSILIVSDISKEKSSFKNNQILLNVKNQINMDKNIFKHLKGINLKQKIAFKILRIYPFVLVRIFKVKYKFIDKLKRG